MKLDLCNGYNNIYIKDGDQWKATFKTPARLFKPMVMFFGLCNSLATFQYFMNDILWELLAKQCIVIYIDDILIFAETLKELQQTSKEVLIVLSKYDLFIKPEKFKFHTQEVKFLGFIIIPGKVLMVEDKLSGIKDWLKPCTPKYIR